MGEHEEENRDAVDRFFNRYMNLVLNEEVATPSYNPLEVYMPPNTFEDLVFVQSRQSFFMRQTIETINDYLEKVIDLEEGFKVGEQEKAWSHFWSSITKA